MFKNRISVYHTMKYVVIAPVGESMDSLYVGLKEFGTERIILIAPKDKIELAQKAKKDLEKFRIQVQIRKIEEIFGKKCLGLSLKLRK